MLVGAMVNMSDQYISYMGSLLNLGGDLSSSSRILRLRHGIEMMIKRPILGVGPGCYPIARSMWFGWSLWAHNHYGQLMGDLGITGTIVWFGFLCSYYKRLLWLKVQRTSNFVNSNNMAKGMIVVTIVRLTLGMGSHSLYTSIWYIIAACAVVCTRAYHDVLPKSEKNT